MRRYFNAFIMCQSMFCAIPIPCKIWDEKARPYMMLSLPFVGLEIGLIWAALAWSVSLLGLPQLVAGAVLCLYPFFITGFIHLDGFMDVTDAVKSWRDLERRREILKDSKVGAFAVIACISLMILQFACCASAYPGADYMCLIYIPIISRCCSALAVISLPAMSGSQYYGNEAKRGHIVILLVVLVAVTAVCFAVCGKFGFVTVGCMAGYGIALLRAFRSLKGMNGDISGYSLTIGELCGLVVLVLI